MRLRNWRKLAQSAADLTHPSFSARFRLSRTVQGVSSKASSRRGNKAAPKRVLQATVAGHKGIDTFDQILVRREAKHFGSTKTKTEEPMIGRLQVGGWTQHDLSQVLPARRRAW